MIIIMIVFMTMMKRHNYNYNIIIIHDHHHHLCSIDAVENDLMGNHLRFKSSLADWCSNIF